MNSILQEYLITHSLPNSNFVFIHLYTFTAVFTAVRAAIAIIWHPLAVQEQCSESSIDICTQYN